MILDKKIGVVIPCFQGGKVTKTIINEALDYADKVVLIDDACPFGTGKSISEVVKSEKLKVLFNSINKGVGYSTKKGFGWLIKEGCDLIIKIDADGQLDPKDIYPMCSPILEGKCEATKGNRFGNIENAMLIPKIRLFGILILSFITKLSTGYWDLFDPTNGYICFKQEILANINMDKIDNRYFFETDLLFRCSLNNVKITNVNVDIKYLPNISTLNPITQAPIFLIKHVKRVIKRIVYQYFIFDFNPGSIELILSFATGVLAVFIGLNSLLKSRIHQIPMSSGNSSLFTIACILAIQLFISFIYYDCTYRVFLRNSKNI